MSLFVLCVLLVLWLRRVLCVLRGLRCAVCVALCVFCGSGVFLRFRRLLAFSVFSGVFRCFPVFSGSSGVCRRCPVFSCALRCFPLVPGFFRCSLVPSGVSRWFSGVVWCLLVFSCVSVFFRCFPLFFGVFRCFSVFFGVFRCFSGVFLVFFGVFGVLWCSPVFFGVFRLFLVLPVFPLRALLSLLSGGARCAVLRLCVACSLFLSLVGCSFFPVLFSF